MTECKKERPKIMANGRISSLPDYYQGGTVTASSGLNL